MAADTQEKQWILSGYVKHIDSAKGTLVIQVDSRCAEIPIPENMPDWVKTPGVDFEVSVPWPQADNEDLSTIDWLNFEPLGYDDLTNGELLDRLRKHSKDI